MIRIQGLHKFFNKGRQNEIHVINDISLDLPERGMVAIFGKSGCGKTTLLNVIGGLDRYAEGTLTIEGRDIRKDTDDVRNRYIGYIFQNYNLNKAESCFDNVADALRLCGMSDEDEIETRVNAALANVDMAKYGKRTPDTLSGGQQQRIAIARAIVKNPRIILADEPTGNLDEANTVMIMDLLKAIAKDHLVLLVTHEAHLVDHYCDTVIELQDGRVVGTRQNAEANGFAARDKNVIWLGEMDRHDLADEHADIEYYGDAPEEPVKLRIIHRSGKLYVQIGTAKVQVIDSGSEIKVREGVYEEKPQQNDISRGIDMSALPPVEGTRFGRLFSFRSSVKSGYAANFKNRKKGKRVLRGCMCLFAAVIVLMSAAFGTAFGKIIDAKGSYNHNVFYLYTPSAEISARLNEAVGQADTGIDYVRLSTDYPRGDNTVGFRTGNFETFISYDYDSNFYTNAVYLDVTLTEGMTLVEGKRDGLASEEILITTKVADALLEKSNLGYITERADLIGLISTTITVNGKYARIAGIVASDESAVYLTEVAMARYVRQGMGSFYTVLASDHGQNVAPGETILAIRNQRENVTYPKVGETIQIQGRDLRVVDVKEFHSDYETWMEAGGIQKKDEFTYFCDMVKAERPDVVEGTEEFYDLVDAARVAGYYEYLVEYYYTEIDGFCRDYLLFYPTENYAWIYVNKGIDAAKYAYMPEYVYKAVAYEELYSQYPTEEQLYRQYDSLPDFYETLESLLLTYEREIYNSTTSQFSINVYMVSEEDYVAFSKQLGDTHPSAMPSVGNVSYGKSFDEGVEVYDMAEGGIVYVEPSEYMETYVTVIHSSDPKKTQAWLTSEFSTLTGPTDYWPAMVTPDDLYDDVIKDQTESIVTSLITMAVSLLLMSLCMYFIMRSSLMNRIKEVGIYRAIGVSKRNLVYKFFIESAVLTTLTALIGYLLTSVFIFACRGMSSMIAEILFYPWWMAGAVFVILYAISLFFGTLPILSLLRKTPSEILAKYDI